MKYLLSILILCFACSTAPLPAPIIPKIRQPELTALPADPKTEATPKTLDNPEWKSPDKVEPVESGSCLDKNGKVNPSAPKPCPPKSGILFSEKRAYQDGMYKLRYGELRVIAEQDRKIWALQRDYYETAAAKMEHQIQILQPGWLAKHELSLGVIGGIVVGITLSTLIMSIVRK